MLNYLYLYYAIVHITCILCYSVVVVIRLSLDLKDVSYITLLLKRRKCRELCLP